MGKNPFGTIFKNLISVFLVALVILLSDSIALGAAGADRFQQNDTVKNKRKDLPKVQVKDTSKPQVKDSGKVIVKGAGGVPVDSAKFQGVDTGRLKGVDSTGVPKADTTQVPDSVIYKQKTFEKEEIIRGERLFEGLVYFGNASVNCAACHNTREIDTLNWNPDALEISRKYLNKTAFDLSRILLKPAGAKMKLVHKEFQLTAKDIVLLKAYMDKFADTGIMKKKPVITNLLLLIIASILFLISFSDLIVKKIFKKRWIDWAIVSVTGTYIITLLAIKAIEMGRYTGFSPAQPIKFSHAVHAGQNKTDCNYCHYTARISKSAGIPPGSICLNCHFLVRNGTRSGATEIAKIIQHLDEKKAVEWVRIYKLPDFVFFSHEQHVSAGQLSCEACHGDVKKVDRLYQYSNLSMGWCIDCHKTRKVNITNEYYKTYYTELYDSLKAGKIDSVRVVGIGGRDCGKCHY